MTSPMDDFGRGGQLLELLMQRGRNHGNFGAGLQQTLRLVRSLFISSEHEDRIAFDIECDRETRICSHSHSSNSKRGHIIQQRLFQRKP